MWTLFVAAAVAAPDPQPPWPVTIAVEVAGTGGGEAAGALGSVRVGWNLRPLTIEIWGGEGYLAGVQRQVGRLGIGLRRGLGLGSYVRAGFTHAHEVPWDTFRHHIGSSLAGTHDGILHRSGIELGAGWLIPFRREGPAARWAVVLDLSTQIYPGKARPIATAQGAVGIAVHLGRPRPPKPPKDPPANPDPSV